MFGIRVPPDGLPGRLELALNPATRNVWTAQRGPPWPQARKSLLFLYCSSIAVEGNLPSGHIAPGPAD